MIKLLKRSGLIIVALLLLTLLHTSCIPQRKVILFQDKNNVGDTISSFVQSITDSYIIKVGDQLYVNVNSPDEKFSKMFNMSSSGNISAMGGSGNSGFYFYEVDDSLNIDMPVVGKINIRNCTVEQAKKRISAAISDYLIEFSVNVKLASNAFVSLGEFAHNGRIQMPKPQITIYEALGLVGGFTTYARRSEVTLMRLDEQGRQVIQQIDLSGRDIINSQFYYVYPNDVLYVRPMRVKALGFGETFSLSLITSLITFYLLIRSLIS